jgi:hypothetical protein
LVSVLAPLIGPASVSNVPLIVTLRSLPSDTGAVIVWLPALTRRYAALAPLSSVSAAAPCFVVLVTSAKVMLPAVRGVRARWAGDLPKTVRVLLSD